MNKEQIDLHQQCKGLLFEVLADFQIIESGLKSLILHKYKSIETITKEVIEIQFDKVFEIKKIKGLGLNQCLDEYQKLHKDNKSVKSIRALVEQRNLLAHEAFKELQKREEQEDYQQKKLELELLKVKLQRCLELMLLDQIQEAREVIDIYNVRDVIREHKYNTDN